MRNTHPGFHERVYSSKDHQQANPQEKKKLTWGFTKQEADVTPDSPNSLSGPENEITRHLRLTTLQKEARAQRIPVKTKEKKSLSRYLLLSLGMTFNCL